MSSKEHNEWANYRRSSKEVFWGMPWLLSAASCLVKWLFSWPLGWSCLGGSFISTLVDDHIASLHKSNRVGKVVFVHKLSGGAEEDTKRERPSHTPSRKLAKKQLCPQIPHQLFWRRQRKQDRSKLPQLNSVGQGKPFVQAQGRRWSA